MLHSLLSTIYLPTMPSWVNLLSIRGDQVAARECYIAKLEMDNHLQTMSIEEQWMVAEPIEGLEEIPLNNSRPE